MKADLFPPVEHAAGVGEEGHFHAVEDLPAVFRIHHQGGIVIEPERAEAAQVVIAAERGLQIERHPISGERAGSLNPAAQGDGAALIEEWDVLLRFQIEAIERIRTTLRAVRGELRRVIFSPMGKERFVAQVELDEFSSLEKIALVLNAGAAASPYRVAEEANSKSRPGPTLIMR